MTGTDGSKTNADVADRLDELVMPEHEAIYLTLEDADEGSFLWCQDRVTGNDIKYIRADIAVKAIKEAVRRPMGVVPDIAEQILEA